MGNPQTVGNRVWFLSERLRYMAFEFGLTKNIQRKKREIGKKDILGTILRVFVITVQFHSVSFQ